MAQFKMCCQTHLQVKHIVLVGLQCCLHASYDSTALIPGLLLLGLALVDVHHNELITPHAAILGVLLDQAVQHPAALSTASDQASA